MTTVKSENTGLTYDDENLASLLFYCSQLRGVSCLPHRTLHEFDWFVSAMIFYDHKRRLEVIESYISERLASGNMSQSEADVWKSLALEEADRERQIHEKYRPVYDNENVEWSMKLVVYARAFVQYCEDEYGVDCETV